MARSVTEWVNVAGGISIIARESGEVWFHTPSGTKNDADPFATPMTGAGAAGSTVGLLDGAINLGFSGIEKRLARPEPTLAGYIVALVGAYHTSVHTPRNLRQAAKRFNELGRPEVAAYLEERAREETGHDRLALKDLRALGVPADRLVANFIPEGIKPLCKRFDDLCAQDYPMGCIGYRTAWSALPRSSRRPISKRFKRCAPMASMRRASSEVTAPSEARSRTSKRRLSSSRRFPANDRIQVVQETYESALIMADGYNHELLKSEEKVLGEIQQAIGEPLLYGHGSRHSPGEKRAARPAA